MRVVASKESLRENSFVVSGFKSLARYLPTLIIGYSSSIDDRAEFQDGVKLLMRFW